MNKVNTLEGRRYKLLQLHLKDFCQYRICHQQLQCSEHSDTEDHRIFRLIGAIWCLKSIIPAAMSKLWLWKKYLSHQYTQYNADYTHQTHFSQLPEGNCRPLEWDQQQPPPPSLKLQYTVRREQLFNILEILKKLEGKNVWLGLESRLNSLYVFNKQKLAFYTNLIWNKLPTALKSINWLNSEQRNRPSRVVSEKLLGNSKCEGAASPPTFLWFGTIFDAPRKGNLFPCFGIRAAYQSKGQTGWVSVA